MSARREQGDRSFVNRCLVFGSFSVLVLALASPTGALGVDRMYVEDVNASADQTSVSVFVRAEHDFDVYAFSSSVQYDPADLQLVDVTIDGTDASAWNFFNGVQSPGVVAYGGVHDLGGDTSNVLPAGDHSLMRMDFDILMPAGRATRVGLVDGLAGVTPINNVLTNSAGLSVVPALFDGRVVRGVIVSPFADAGPDQIARGGATVMLDGSRSLGENLEFSWEQISGPPATLSGEMTSLLTVELPPVFFDSDLVFALTATNDSGSDTDEVLVVASTCPPPLADAGGDAFAAELDAVALKGVATSGIRTYSWRQIAGPEVESFTGTDEIEATVILPPVNSDTDFEFEFSVDDDCGDDSDRVVITAVDIDRRRSDLTARPGFAPKLMNGGNRALLFAGRIEWRTDLEPGEWSGMRFTASGAGNESRLLGDVTLYLDENENGMLDAGEEELAFPQRFSRNDGAIDIAIEERTLTRGSATHFVLVADVVDPAPPAESGDAWFLLFGVSFVAAWRLRRSRRFSTLMATGAVVAIAIIPVACGGGGGGGSGGVVSREVEVGIVDGSDIIVHGEVTGVRGIVGGLPILGGKIDV